eukprot:gnl/TRDRNA2_/TRDRNA2_173028_c10_seq1.p1 gnl/TRDRNA2_/TRDRNA2_173028_c10~~gnl/TRDRNA2_/TRDRNA2_173028_c10_seq1.p1  ORF type:complete len:153 (-),score=14.57 gnl/TRDRNA2_/TRDRNA2_173028_c10_seq1:75-533(-)
MRANRRHKIEKVVAEIKRSASTADLSQRGQPAVAQPDMPVKPTSPPCRSTDVVLHVGSVDEVKVVVPNGSDSIHQVQRENADSSPSTAGECRSQEPSAGTHPKSSPGSQRSGSSLGKLIGVVQKKEDFAQGMDCTRGNKQPLQMSRESILYL